MPWLITHRCIVDVAEPVPYAIERGRRQGEDVTRIACVEARGCHEEFFILGHELFRDAQRSDAVQGFNLPPGFVVAKTRSSELDG